MAKTVGDFVWTGGPSKPTARLVKWDTTSLSICYGGLGIESLRQKNVALLTKWLWRFCKKDNAFRRCIIVAIYGLEDIAWATKVPNRGRSFRLWAGILKHKEFLNLVTFLLGHGKNIRFWIDSWCEAQPLAEIPRCFLLISE